MDIGTILFRRGLLDLQQLETARAMANGRRIDQIAIEMGFVPENAALSAIGDELGLAYVDLREFAIEKELLGEFPTALIFRHALLPLYRKNNRVVIATSDPFDLEALNELSSASGQRLIPVLAARDEIERLIKEQLGLGGDTVGALIAQQQEEGVELLDDIPDELGELAQEAQTASVIRLVNELLVEALEQEASDIHIEPQERGLTIRYRVDGLLRVQPVPAEIIHFQNAIITRLKIMARLNIAEKRRPQDGRIKLKVSGREIDVRVSIIPMLYGEGIVMRLLDKERMRFDLHRVGMPAEIEGVFREMIALPHGIVLVTGPTGSGKTSTLYSG
ncbi:MAG: ATPase, T2SS/T4P/T4SS family, partial [Planctomycetaceae bacterium]